MKFFLVLSPSIIDLSRPLNCPPIYQVFKRVGTLEEDGLAAACATGLEKGVSKNPRGTPNCPADTCFGFFSAFAVSPVILKLKDSCKIGKKGFGKFKGKANFLGIAKEDMVNNANLQSKNKIQIFQVV